MTLYLVTGLVLIVLPIAFNALFFMLGRAFEYPDILRQPTDAILTRFVAGGRRLIGLWYGFALTALIAIPLALLLGAVFQPEQPQLAGAVVVFGVLSGLTQALGLLRWPLLVPVLAAQYTSPDASPARREAVAVVFNAFHQYIGVVVGEHLGYLFTGVWSIVIGILMIQSPLFSPVLGIIGILAALGILTGMLEPAGWKPAGMINALSYIVWSLWLIVAGIVLIAAAL